MIWKNSLILSLNGSDLEQMLFKNMLLGLGIFPGSDQQLVL